MTNQKLSTELCWRCGVAPRFLRGLYCPPCSREAGKECDRRYFHSTKGQAVAKRRLGDPKRKIRRALHADEHKEQRNQRDRERRAKQWADPQIVRCQNQPCEGRWARTPRNGKRELCSPCRLENRCYMALWYRNRKLPKAA